MVEQVAPQFEHHPLTDAGEHEPRRRAEQPGGEPDADVGDHVEREPLRVGRRSRCRWHRRRSSSRGQEPQPKRGDRHHDGDPAPPPDGVAPEAGEAGVAFQAARASSPKSSVNGTAAPDQVLGEAALDDRGRRRARRPGPRPEWSRAAAPAISTVRPADGGAEGRTRSRSVSVSTADIGSSRTIRAPAR